MSSVSNSTGIYNPNPSSGVDNANPDVGTPATGNSTATSGATQTGTTTQSIPFHDLILPRNSTTALGMRTPMNHGDTEAVFAELMLKQQELQQNNVDNALRARAGEVLNRLGNVQNNEERLAAAEAELELLKSNPPNLGATIANLQTQVTDKTAQRADLVSQQATATEPQLTELNTQIAALDTEIADLQDQIEVLENTASVDEQIAALESEIGQLEDSIAEGELEVQHFFAEVTSTADQSFSRYLDKINIGSTERNQIDERLSEGSKDLSSLDAKDQLFQELREVLNEDDAQTHVAERTLDAILKGLEDVKEALASIPSLAPSVITGPNNTSSNATDRLELTI